ncbi:sulfate ABC transporter ATP-binding protein [Komagataeibacter rhaeticus]|uniref:sulfate/molybdate ABC transporter ATP-binding protein n=1 Tax=Komagataeibacter rhaeticus TaxID=215221 RepID=UPI0004D34E44|nr:ATP-binding cassette domain-containing protein [Komagataeibacter rhaeticus]KDU96725.1 sulfate ABC transporter ATP-binding protein [Komagataeibacter rhaeticus AF1]PYD54351.1 sulfate ABC transporter ATP-binding protein [Komagataeibacter rhaeticus]GBQ14602.1 sulfate ABC transporter ATP-binding protein [Komagataeibacter rhaeticus DSM 16663]
MSVQLEQITRRNPRNGRPIVDNVSLAVASGSFTALVGPSGAGKTSLLRIIAGLDPHQAGHVSIDGTRVDTLDARARNIGFVFQHYALFAHMSVAANIGFGLSVRPRGQRPRRDVIARRVEDLLDLMQLSGLGGRYPHELSGGQRQRVALARTLATGPRVLLLDEPFGALDPLVRRQIRGWLRSLHERLGLTTILVTHDRQEAAELADTVVLMRHGRIVQAGTPQALEDTPADPFTMAFTGDLVRLGGRVENHVFTPDLPDILPVTAPIAAGPAELLVRPVDIALRPGQGQATAVLRQARGPLGLYDVRLGTDTLQVETLMPPDRPRILPHCALDVTAGRLARDNAWASVETPPFPGPPSIHPTGERIHAQHS